MKRTALKRGQSMLEYVIVLTAIVAGLVFALGTLFRPNTAAGLGQLLDKAGATIETKSQEIEDMAK